jgi:hypothetical protein
MEPLIARRASARAKAQGRPKPASMGPRRPAVGAMAHTGQRRDAGRQHRTALPGAHDRSDKPRKGQAACGWVRQRTDGDAVAA